MEKLGKTNREKVIDVLCERLAFERSGVKLYDTLIQKMQAGATPTTNTLLQRIRENRDQEKEHEEWLEDQVRSLGGDDQKLTERAQLVTRESKGIEDVIQNDPEIPHLFHALLAAELVDHAGWDLLVQLADEAEDREARDEFKKRLQEEEEHLLFVREAVANMSLSEVFGRERPLTP